MIKFRGAYEKGQYRVEIAESGKQDVKNIKKYILKPADTYLLFYIIDEQKRKVIVLRIMQDGMNWQFIMKRWIQQKECR